MTVLKIETPKCGTFAYSVHLASRYILVYYGTFYRTTSKHERCASQEMHRVHELENKKTSRMGAHYASLAQNHKIIVGTKALTIVQIKTTVVLFQKQEEIEFLYR